MLTQTRSNSHLTLEKQDYVERLQASSAMAGVSTEAVEAFAGLATPRRFKKGEAILSEGQKAQALYLILNGRVKMSRPLPTGRNVVLGLFHPGDLFATVAALGDGICRADLTAQQSTTCLEVRRDQVYELFEQRPRLISELLPVLTQQLVECRNCIVEFTCYRVEMRFAQLLLKFADNVGRQERDGTFIPIPLSRQELADMTGTTIETCIRIMSRWAKENTVETRRDGFLVHDRGTLEGMAAGAA